MDINKGEDGNNIITTRFDKTLLKIMKEQIKATKMSVREILELGFIEQLNKIDINLKYENLDLKELANLRKLEIMRKMASAERNEFLSKNLFMARVKRDIFKIIALTKKTDNNKIFEKLNQYLEIRKKESYHYKDNEELNKELDFYQESILRKDIDSIKKYLEDSIDLEHIKKSISK